MMHYIKPIWYKAIPLFHLPTVIKWKTSIIFDFVDIELIDKIMQAFISSAKANQFPCFVCMCVYTNHLSNRKIDFCSMCAWFDWFQYPWSISPKYKINRIVFFQNTLWAWVCELRSSKENGSINDIFAHTEYKSTNETSAILFCMHGS